MGPPQIPIPIRRSSCLLLVLVVSLFARTGLAALVFTMAGYADVTIARPFEITWSGSNGLVRIELLGGKSEADMLRVLTIGSNLSGTSFTWTPSEIPDGYANYALSITDSANQVNYSPLFQISRVSVLAPGSSPSPSPSTTPPPPPATATLPTASPPNSVQSGMVIVKELTTGEKVGIGIGATLGGLLLISATGYFFYRKGKAAAAAGKDGEDVEEQGSTPKTSHDDDNDSNGPAELGGKIFVEVSSEREVAEMWCEKDVLEMETSANTLELGGVPTQESPVLGVSPLVSEQSTVAGWSPLSRTISLSPVTPVGQGDFGHSGSPAELSCGIYNDRNSGKGNG